jgi:hypothetical protein
MSYDEWFRAEASCLKIGRNDEGTENKNICSVKWRGMTVSLRNRKLSFALSHTIMEL